MSTRGHPHPEIIRSLAYPVDHRCSRSTKVGGDPRWRRKSEIAARADGFASAVLFQLRFLAAPGTDVNLAGIAYLQHARVEPRQCIRVARIMRQIGQFLGV